MILHVDMDAFYASVEQRDNPDWRGRCVVVGGSADRGVVSAASYEARKYGVRSAMPVFQARRICPDAVFIRPRMPYYRQVSARIMEILRSYTPLVETVSIDEAYLDVSGCERCHGTPIALAGALKHRIREAERLRCSVGIAPVKFLAKIASDMDKPDGLTVIPPARVAEFIDTLPVCKVPGVGRKTAAQLAVFQIHTLGDVNRFPRQTLVRRLGKFGHRLADLAAGMDDSRVMAHETVKSISSEETLPQDTDDLNILEDHLLAQAGDVGRQLRKKGVRARTVTIKIKHSDFRQVTRSSTLSTPIQSAERIYREAVRLLAEYPLTSRVRLVGVGVSGLRPQTAPVQRGLFDDAQSSTEHWEKIENVMDAIDRKFGEGSVQKARLVVRSCGKKS